MKSIVSLSAVVVAGRFIGFVAVMGLAALPALGAGSAKQPVRKDGDPSITSYNQEDRFYGLSSKIVDKHSGWVAWKERVRRKSQ